MHCEDSAPVIVDDSNPAVNIDFQLEKGGIITGTVYQTDGTTPINGWVAVDVYAGDPCGQNEYVTGVWTNTPGGTYVINGVPEGTYFLKTSPWETNYVSEFWNVSGSSTHCSDAQPVMATVGMSITGRDFQLEEGGMISGVVTDNLGYPIQGLWVQAFLGLCWDGWTGGASTDENGFYTIKALGTGDYYIQACPTCNDQAFADTWWTKADGTYGCDSAEPVDVIAQQIHTGVNFELTAVGSIAGRVLSDGEPVSGLWIEVWADTCWNGWLNGGATDENGFYTVDNIPVGDVYVRTCAECDQKNYIDLWYAGDTGTQNCSQAEAVAVNPSGASEPIDFNLERGPRRENWTEVSVYDGVLGVGFDLQPGFNDLIVSATLFGPDGLLYEFDLQSDTFQWLNDCYLNQTMWWKDLTQGDEIVYGEYQLTLGFRDGYEKTYIHHLQQVSLTPVDENSMSHVVNPDGGIDFSYTKPAAPDQWYRVMIYDGGNRYLSLRVQDSMPVHVTPYQLRCLEPGGDYTWHIRVHDLNEPYNATLKTARLPLAYNLSELQDRVTSFSATRATTQDDLWLFFNTRSGSRNNVTSATVIGPSSFNYTFDLNEDWFDLSTETRILNGWNKAISLPVPFGDYDLNVQFNDGYSEKRTFNLPEVTVVSVAVETIHVYVLENGAGYSTWELPPGITGQYYQVRIHSADGLQEFYASNSVLDDTSHYSSTWDLRGLVHGNVYQFFIRAYDADFTTMAQSESLVSIYDPFELVPPTDIDGDRDVDGADLLALILRIQDGLIENVDWTVELMAQRFGLLQLN